MKTAEIWDTESASQCQDDSLSTNCNVCKTPFTFRTGGETGEIKCPKCPVIYKFWDNSKTDWGLEPK